MTFQISAKFRVDRGNFNLDVDLSLPGRGITALFGHSGSGKTTCLRAMAGLERAPDGYFTLGDEVWQDEARRHFVPPHRRAIGVVFQEASLFPHLSVRANMEVGVFAGDRQRALGGGNGGIGLFATRLQSGQIHRVGQVLGVGADAGFEHAHRLIRARKIDIGG